jgi:flagellar hook protein FlgE
MSFNIALSGLNAATTDLNVISNNIANANTTGFKTSTAEFGDLVQGSQYSVANVAAGDGVNTQQIAQQFTQGTITTTGEPLNLAINGNGFFTLSNNGATVYSRDGTFSTNNSGYVVNPNGAILQVYPPVGSTNTFSTGTLTDLKISTTPSAPAATTTLDAAVTLPGSASVPTTTTFSATDPTSYNSTTAVTVYDSLGAAHSANLYYVQTSTPGTWTVHTLVDGKELGTGTTVSFDSSGNLTSPTGSTSLPAFTPTTGAAAVNISLNLSGTEQYGSSFSVNSISQNGYATGQLSGLQIAQNGAITAQYTNGQTTTLGQVAMANFANPQGLQQLGNAMWSQSYASGAAITGSAGSSNFGTLQSGSIETSNVDLTTQLVNMMTAQRNYQANSQVISTQDELLQTLLHLQ